MTSHPPCPHCGSNRVAIQETRRNLDGTIRRRMHCNACLGSFAMKMTSVEAPLRKKTGKALSDDLIQAIITAPDDENNVELARRLGIDRKAEHHQC